VDKRKTAEDFRGDSVEAVLDRLPTAEIVNEQEGMYTITAKVFSGEASICGSAVREIL
jgi:hypothetical protein